MPDKLTVLVTACGCPGGPSLVRALRDDFRVVATDCNPEAAGRHFADAFHVVPRGSEPGFVDALLDVCRREGVAAVLPESSNEVLALAGARAAFEALGAKVLVSSPEAVALALDKAETYQAMEGSGVPLPEYRLVEGYAGERREYIRLLEAIQDAGRTWRTRWPVVLKRPDGKGGRGFWVVTGGDLDRVALDVREWPNAQRLSIREVTAWAWRRVNRGQPLGRWLIMEYLEDDEYLEDETPRPNVADLYGTAFGFTKYRTDCRGGVHFYHEARYDPGLLDLARRVVERLGLEHFVNVQFMGGKLLEVNPRISTMIYAPGFNMPALGVKWALGLVDRVTATLPDGTRSQYYLDLRSY